MRLIRWLKLKWKGILSAGWRIVAYETFNYVFNYPLYFGAMSYFGLARGWFIMTVASLVTCAYLFWRYDVNGNDWLFANTAKEQVPKPNRWVSALTTKILESRNRFMKILAVLVRGIRAFVGIAIKVSESKNGFAKILVILSKVSVFFLANINVDPLIVAVYHQKSHFKGIGFKDWGILAVSVAVANLWWGFRIGVFVEILKWLKHL